MYGCSRINSAKYVFSKNAINNAIPAALPKTIKFEYLNIFGTFSSELFQLYTEILLEFRLKNRVKIDLPNESILFNLFLTNGYFLRTLHFYFNSKKFT